MYRELLGLFPVPVGIIDNFLSEKEIELLLKEVISIDHSDHGALSGEAFSTHKVDGKLGRLLEDLSHKLNIDFIERLNTEINDFAGTNGLVHNNWIQGMSRLMIDNSWSNIQKKGSYLRRHTHPNSKISGSLFLNVDQDSSKLYFFNPNPYIKYEDYDKVTDFSSVNYSIQPSNGQLILFPSWLEHGSNEEINNTDKRVVISFNSAFYRSN